MADSEKRNKATVRRYGLRPIAQVADALTRPAFGRRGFALGALLTHWPQIIGPELADCTQPEKLHFPQGKGDSGTLMIRADGGAALEIQHLQPLICERINSLCGFRAVAELRIIQGPVTARPKPPKPPRPLLPAEKQVLERNLAEIGDPDLWTALEKLGAGIYARKKPC